jgi:hypothetical protein
MTEFLCTLLFSEKNSSRERWRQLGGSAAGVWSVFGHRSCAWTWQHGLGHGGARARGRRQARWREAGRSSRAGGREAGKVQDRWWRAQARGREAGKARSTAETFGSSTGRPAGRLLPCLRCEREAGGTSRGRPAGGRRREGRPGRAGGSSSSSTAGLPLDGEELDFDFTIQGPQIGRIKMWRGFSQKDICSDSASSISIRREYNILGSGSADDSSPI